MRKLSLPISLVFAISFMVQAGAQEVLELEGTEITGNKESPNVLYIVPWKSVERFDVEAPPIVSIMDQQLAPIERASFRRSIHYHDAIYSNSKPE